MQIIRPIVFASLGVAVVALVARRVLARAGTAPTASDGVPAEAPPPLKRPHKRRKRGHRKHATATH